MTILESLALGKNKENKKVNSKSSYNSKEGKITDKYLIVCPACNVVWEKVHWRNKILIEYYHEIPRYGKKNEVCPECSEKAVL
ncbi:MAG: hypothetical protein CMG19_04910 [Candidatus Marinimicrobia bacterium]|nr:hypothetical protein [Candidatus Neomarinimicrobiota bacterium]|tara:strand:- start:180 stop:428 length:249 start_codon:yes stop_codon:yes gene_type:complete